MNAQTEEPEFDAGECLIDSRWRRRAPELGNAWVAALARIDRAITGALAVVEVLAADNRRARCDDACEGGAEPRLSPIAAEGLEIAAEQLLRSAEDEIDDLGAQPIAPYRKRAES